MSIEGLSSISSLSNAYTTEATKEDELGRDQFLTLLVAQLKNQDPLNPMESTEFTAQLAQFSSLEQLFGVNENLKNMQAVIEGQSNGNPIDYIGKTVKADDNSICLVNGQSIPGSFSIDEQADVTAVVYDGDGREIRRLYPGMMDKGEHSLDWNGRNESGTLMTDGAYTFEVYAKNLTGTIIPVETFTTGEVTGVTNKYGLPYLMLGDKLISSSNVIEVKQTEE